MPYRTARAKRDLLKRKPDPFLCGHSHIAQVMRDRKLNLLHLNPGVCGRIGWHEQRTILRFTMEASKIGNVELIELGKRARAG
jgi:uncharacterized protein